MNSDTNFTGTYMQLASIAVFILSKLGINTTVDSVLAIISVVGIIAGMIKQGIDHHKLSQVAKVAEAEVAA